MSKILVYRFSAMGDVVLLLPVLKGVLAANNTVEIYLATQVQFFPVFQHTDRLHLIEADLKGNHKGFTGLFNLYRKITRDIKPDKVIDLHAVLRTFTLDFLFWITGYPLIIFRKGTFRKIRVVKSKMLDPLPSSIDRYSDAFTRAGFQIKLPDVPLFSEAVVPLKFAELIHQSIVIGIAPFAKHAQKIWGIRKIELLIQEINRFHQANILLFGGGETELKYLTQLSLKYPNCIVSAHHFSFRDEIQIFPKLTVMVSMDSANMHLAAMAGVPTVSIWGATHPALGFAPYQQPMENIIQYEGTELPCRPCSVYGNKKCIYTDSIRCMENIPVSAVMVRVNQILSERSIQNVY